MNDDDIAIVGIALRFADAATPTQFRENLRSGRDSVGDMPPERAAATGLDPDDRFVPMGHLRDISTFDYKFFQLSKREASLMDPQHRLGLVLAHQAIEDGGYAAARLRDSETAVVLSAAASTYDPGEHSVLSGLGNTPFGLPARIAHFLSLVGPCYAVDSGCNGSLIAVHQACREIRDGAVYALAGGLSLRPGGLPATDTEGFTELVSPGGRCRAFDTEADGTASGEGGAVLMLTTVARARADGASVYAVVRGSAMLHNGHSAATISSPSAKAQAKVIAKAWRAAGLDPASAGYLEAHGSGTRLGDAVEVAGITEAFAGRTRDLPIGSVKTNIGHLDHAAGIAGLVKTVLSVRHGELYPSLHFTRPATAMPGIGVVTSYRRWAEPGRLAGVSSFSLGGINAHMVVEQAPVDRRATGAVSATVPRLVGVSARSPEALASLCRELSIELRDTDLGFDDVVFTLTCGRSHYEHRVAVVARDTADLAVRLAAQATWLDPRPVRGTQPPAVALVLSPDALPTGTAPRPLPPELPVTGADAELLARQLAVYEALTRAGVVIDALLGAGISRYAVRYLEGALTPRDSERLAAAQDGEEVDPTRLAAAVDKLTARGPVVFLEPAPEGSIGRLLARTGPADVHIASEHGGPAELLGELYQRGVDLDWPAIAPLDARRVRLPGHPLTGSVCWTDVRAPKPPVRPVEPTVARSTGAQPTDHVAWMRTTLTDLLRVETEVGPDDDYFELGGNSIIALELVDRIEAQFGARPKLIDIYQRPKVADFAAVITEAGAPGTTRPTGLPPVTPRDDLVLSFGQERMWFHHQLDENTTLYNLPMVGRVRGRVDADAIRGTWSDLAQRHEVLRSNFVEVDGAPTLRIRPDLGDFFRFVDVSGEADPWVAARHLVGQAAAHRFDLELDPLVRVLVVRMGPDDHVVQVTMHHAVNDGGAPKIFQRELPELYAARREGRQPVLPPLPVRFRDYAIWQRELLASSALDHELRYWEGKLRDAPVLDLPTDFARPARKRFIGDLRVFEVDAALLRDVRGLAVSQSVTLFLVLLSALYVLLARYSGQRDLVVGTPTAGRGRPELKDLIGFFNSTVALRADLSGAPTVADLLRRVRSVVLEAVENQEIPFDRVVSALGGERDLGRAPLFDVFYVHQELPAVNTSYTGESEYFDEAATPANMFGGMPAGTAKFDLTLVTSDRAGADTMTACLEFSTELFEPGTADELISAYLGILRGMVADPTADVEKLLVPPVSTVEVTAPVVPTDRPRTGDVPSPTRSVTWTPTELLCARLRDVADGGDVAPVLLAGWLVLLSWVSGDDEVAVAADSLVRVDLSDEPGFAEVVMGVRQALTAGNPAPEAFPVRFGMPRAGTELSLSVVDGADPEVRMHYAPDLFDEATATRLLVDVQGLLGGLVADPARSVQEVAFGHVDGPDPVAMEFR